MISEETRKILERNTYANPIRYISGNMIEYDIKSANITMLYTKGLIDQSYYEYLSRLPKFIREKEIGLAEDRDPNLYPAINDGIKEYKIKLAEANNIEPYEIIRVANDAVVINRAMPFKYTTFDNVFFKTSNPINVYMKILDILVFATIQYDGNISLDVKGIGDNLYMFQNTMLQIIGTIIFLIERSSIQDAVNYISEILEDYIHKKLDIEYYREFSSNAFFKINNSIGFGILQSDGLSIDDIDINYNLYILRELWSIVLEKYDKVTR